MYLLFCCVFFVFTHMRYYMLYVSLFLIWMDDILRWNQQQQQCGAKTTQQTFDTFHSNSEQNGGTQVLCSTLKVEKLQKVPQNLLGLLLEKSQKNKKQTALAHTQSCCLLNHSTKGSIAQQTLHRGEGGGVRWRAGARLFFFSLQSFKSFNALAFWCSDARTVSLCKKKKNLQNEPGTYRSALTDCSPLYLKRKGIQTPSDRMPDKAALSHNSFPP